MARGVAALLFAGGGSLVAQSPTASTVPAALAQPRPTGPAFEQPIVLMRTAGQPDRQLKVIKHSTYSDGEAVSEVQDVLSGQIFTLPGKVVAMLPKATGSVAPPAPISSPVTVPTPPVRPSSPVGLPVPKAVEPPMPKVIFIPAPAPPMPKVIFIPAPAPKVEVEVELPPVLPPSTTLPAPGASLVWRPRPMEMPALTPALTPVEPAKPDRWQPAKRMDLQSRAKGIELLMRLGYHGLRSPRLVRLA